MVVPQVDSCTIHLWDTLVVKELYVSGPRKKNINDVLWEDEYDYDDSSSITNKPVKENEVNEAQ